MIGGDGINDESNKTAPAPTALNRQISDIVARENELRTQIDAIIADLES